MISKRIQIDQTMIKISNISFSYKNKDTKDHNNCAMMFE
jgi:hypothetical protein